MAVEAFPACLLWPTAPCWDVAGGHVASEIRKIHDDSSSVFADSVYSTPSGRLKRWTSLMHWDYLPLIGTETGCGNTRGSETQPGMTGRGTRMGRQAGRAQSSLQGKR